MGESSPDLSLRLRQGSSDSRDSFYMDFAQGIDSDIEEVTRPGDNNSDPMLENHLEENGNELPPIEDITTIPEEASEELREEEEAAALEAALRTPDGGTISTEIEKPPGTATTQE
ncbi:hypothetical protein EAI_07030 [Harpegnathos saltator]|uniref:Uncharacterized protein n=1 Tax=Harpegnathos saltator TaxID=610380 RepID=E2BVD5_HARSA|nr:hypothetical protein EAI_07030 [Harpegnathos saltator]